MNSWGCGMKIINIIVWLRFIIIVLPFTASAHAAEANKIRVFVSILPQAYFVERIGGDKVGVEVMVGPGQSPETYEPTSRQMALLTKSDVYFQIGMPFEKRLIEKLAGVMEKLNMVPCQKGVKHRFFNSTEAHAGHEETGADPHIWLDPMIVKVISGNICDELIRLDSAHKADYENNLRLFLNDLDSTNERISRLLAPFQGRVFYVFHPVMGYFADRYGLRQIAVEIEGKEPSAKQLADLIDKAKADGIKVIFVQPQFSTKSARTVASAIGGVVTQIDPLSRDYIMNLEEMAGKLAEGLKTK